MYSNWTEGERSVPIGAYGDSDAACITISAAKSRYSMSEILSSGGKEGTDIGCSRVGAAVKIESCKRLVSFNYCSIGVVRIGSTGKCRVVSD